MDLSTVENFFFLPSPDSNKGCLHVLEPAEQPGKDTFVLLPYQNPQVKIPQARYYQVAKKIMLDPAQIKKEGYSPPIAFTALTSQQNYLENVKKLKEEIQRGNIYEINYCIKFLAENISIDPLSVFLKLHTLAKAPYACFLKTGDDFIICASPELFLKREGHLIQTKPIKGTIKRGKTPEEDAQLKDSLYNNIKERTENVMAVDVARNDLSRFAKKGTVAVNKLYNIETFETVHQMVSTVSCEIKDELLKESSQKIFDTLIDATFPMASMTGAPKIRAMQLIDAFENFERGSYSGAMGLIDENEDFSFCVIIRSLFYSQKTKHLSFAVGGAITYLSEPEKEYEECLLKAEALLKVLNAVIV